MIFLFIVSPAVLMPFTERQCMCMMCQDVSSRSGIVWTCTVRWLSWFYAFFPWKVAWELRPSDQHRCCDPSPNVSTCIWRVWLSRHGLTSYGHVDDVDWVSVSHLFKNNRFMHPSIIVSSVHRPLTECQSWYSMCIVIAFGSMILWTSILRCMSDFCISFHYS